MLFMVFKSYHKEVLYLSPSFLFLLYYIAFRYFADIDLYRQTGRIEIIFYPFLAMLSLGLGSIVQYYASHQPMFSRSMVINERLVIIFSIIGVIAVMIYYSLSGTIPILHGLQMTDSEMNMHEARRSITYAHRHGQVNYFGQGYFKYFYLTILPITSFYLYFNSRVRGKKNLLFLILLIYACISQVLDSRLIPIGRFFIFFYITYILIQNRFLKKVGFSQIIRTAVIFVAIVYFLFLFQSSVRREAEDVGSAFINRLFLIPTGKLYILFPDIMAFRNGSTWLNDFLGFLPGASENFRYEVHEIIHGSSHGFTLSPTVFGSIYINFGVTGILLIPFFIGYVVNAVGAFLLKHDSVMALILYSYFISNIMYSSVSDIVTVVLPIFSVLVFSVLFRKIKLQ